jgi:hypothetical protein
MSSFINNHHNEPGGKQTPSNDLQPDRAEEEVTPILESSELRRVRANPRSLTPQKILQMQRVIGNQQVMRLLGKTQPKPVIQRSPVAATTIMRITMNFDEGDTGRTVHTMDKDHAWDTLVALTGDPLADYKLVQPFLTEAVNSGIRRNLGPNKEGIGQPAEFTWVVPAERTLSGQAETLKVKGIDLEGKDTFKVGDAWVVSNRRALANAAKKQNAKVNL